MATAAMNQATEQKRARTKQDNDERKNRVQSDGRSLFTRSIAQAVVLKDGDLIWSITSDESDLIRDILSFRRSAYPEARGYLRFR